jgi:ribosomal protein L19
MGPPPTKRPVTARVFTKGTLRRQALKQTQPFYIGPTEFRKIKLGGFGRPVNTKLPWELRDHKPDFHMRALRSAEVERLRADPQRFIDDFKAGDKIVVTRYVSLNDRTKFERVAGLCLAREGGSRLSASFLVRSHKLGEDYEMRFPLWSPFIAQIHRLEEGQQNFRRKMYYLREGPRTGWEVKIPPLPKPVVAPVTLDRISKESAGKVVVLQHHPMKKQLKERRAGGLGAELAAAGGGDKKGAAAAKPAAAPKKK